MILRTSKRRPRNCSLLLKTFKLKYALFVTILFSFLSVITAQKPIEKVPFSNDYRSGEVSALTEEQFLQYRPVQMVIRMNGQSSDSNGLSIEEERRLCQKYGIVFKYLPMKKPYEQWGLKVAKLMQSNTCLVKCHHGYDRTGFVVAYYLMVYKHKKFDWVQRYNGWNKYDRYSKKFYPTLKNLEK